MLNKKGAEHDTGLMNDPFPRGEAFRGRAEVHEGTKARVLEDDPENLTLTGIRLVPILVLEGTANDRELNVFRE